MACMSTNGPGQAPSAGPPGQYPPPGGSYPPGGPVPPAAPSPHGAPAPGSPQPPGPPRGGRWRTRGVLIPVIVIAVLGLVAAAAVVFVRSRGVDLSETPEGTPSATGKAAELPTGRTWLSGAWSGGGISVDRIKGFGDWRGQPADLVTTYPAYDTWDELRSSDWHINTFDSFSGRLAYGLPLLPKEGDPTLAEVADGSYDDVWASIADTLVKHNRGDTFVRIGLEANGTWFPWGATADSAEDYKAAWRHVQKVMKARAPELVFGFDITCAKALEGGSDRLDSLNRLYPGDDVVDVVGCDHYDSYTVKTRNEDEWERALRPPLAAGLADVSDFARAHGKKLAIPEWGLTASGPDEDGKDRDGAGDNPFFIYKMYEYFQTNKDILAYENYFNEPADYLASSIWEPVQHPRASAEYRKLWSAPPAAQPSP